MSNEDAKIKRSKRLLKERNATIKQAKIAKRSNFGTDRPLGVWKKRHANDCGRPRCGLCSFHRETNGAESRTIQERSFAQIFKSEN